MRRHREQQSLVWRGGQVWGACLAAAMVLVLMLVLVLVLTVALVPVMVPAIPSAPLSLLLR